MKLLVIMVVTVAFLVLKTWSPVTLTPPQAGILSLLVQRSKLRLRAVSGGGSQTGTLAQDLALLPPLSPLNLLSGPALQASASRQTCPSVPMALGAVPSSPREWLTCNLSLERVF